MDTAQQATMNTLIGAAFKEATSTDTSIGRLCSYLKMHCTETPCNINERLNNARWHWFKDDIRWTYEEEGNRSGALYICKDKGRCCPELLPYDKVLLIKLPEENRAFFVGRELDDSWDNVYIFRLTDYFDRVK